MKKRLLTAIAALSVLLCVLIFLAVFLPKAEPSAEVPSPTEVTEPSPPSAAFTGDTWQEAYEKILFSDPADYQVLVSFPDEQADRLMHMGLHDFDGDSVPELIIGDLSAPSVFTYQDGEAQKIADLYIPGIVWCVNGICFRGNGISASCAGARVVNYVNFGWVDGAYQLGYYTEQCPDFDPPQINGRKATLADMDRIYPISNQQFYPEDLLERFRMTLEGDVWTFHFFFPNESTMTVQKPFDWSRFWLN